MLILTDDQGYGDLSAHGNPILKTPHIDRLAAEGVALTQFRVCPVCSPTRAGLMTGRYNYRTGVLDTFMGRSMMHPDETTLAEMLAKAGYATGLFGKWHLGDNYPLRPADRGFARSLWHYGGGIAQSSDPPGGGSYFDPLLVDDGRLVQHPGYCTDVFTQAAMAFIEAHRDRPWFAYLATNAPHTPLQVADRDADPFRQRRLTVGDFPVRGRPIEGAFDAETTARVYGMVSNIDDNVGRLVAKLEELGLARNTVVVFFSDNGPQQPRYNAGLRDRKGTVYDGGLRVPCFVRWPQQLPAGAAYASPAAHIDLAPTLLAAAGVVPPAGVAFDGVNLLDGLRQAASAAPPTPRTLVYQWHRGDRPERYRACAVVTEKWKLVQPVGMGSAPMTAPRFELYDIAADPSEITNLAESQPAIVADLKARYDAWFDAVTTQRGPDFTPPRIVLGHPDGENPTTLTRQDWRDPNIRGQPNSPGFWLTHIAQPGRYRFTLRLLPNAKVASLQGPDARVVVDFSPQKSDQPAVSHTAAIDPASATANQWVCHPVLLPSGPARVAAEITSQGRPVGVHQIVVERLPDIAN